MTNEGDQKKFEALPSADTNLTGDQSGNHETNGNAEPLSDKKRIRTGSQDVEMAESPVKRQKGVAPIKAE
jgi:tRNA-dihydrouridine synthase 3